MIAAVAETLGMTTWTVRVEEALGALPAEPGLTLTVVQPSGCGPDGRRRTWSHGVLNRDLPAGTEVLIAFHQPLPTIGNVGLRM